MDLARSATVWKEGFWRKFALPLRLSRELVELRDRFREERIQVRNELDKNDNFASVTLTGVKLGVNTSDEGLLYVRFVANSSNWDVKLYKATGGGGSDLMASITNLANAGTGSLVAANDSGLGGSITIGTGTAEADDVHVLRVFPDWRKDAAAIFDGSEDSITGDDSRSLFAFYDALNDLGELADDMLARVDTYMSEFMVSAADNSRSYGAEWLGSAESVLLSETTTTDAGGAVSRIRGGVLQDLKLAMESDSVGAQTVLRRLTAGAAAVPDSGNSALGSVDAHTPEGHAKVGTYYLTCVSGLGTGDGGAERFRVSFASSVDDESFTMSELLTIKQSYKGSNGFGPIVLNRTLTKTGDVGTNTELSATTSGWSTVGESEDNTSSGTLYWKIVANGSNWTLSFYKAIGLASADKVAEVLSVATGASFTATPKNGSGLTISGGIGSGPTADTSGLLVLNFHSVQNSQNKPDRYSIAVTETSTGQASRIIADRFGYSLNGAASGETATDAMFKANTFTPFIVEDN